MVFCLKLFKYFEGSVFRKDKTFTPHFKHELTVQMTEPCKEFLHNGAKTLTYLKNAMAGIAKEEVENRNTFR